MEVQIEHSDPRSPSPNEVLSEWRILWGPPQNVDALHLSSRRELLIRFGYTELVASRPDLLLEVQAAARERTQRFLDPVQPITHLDASANIIRRELLKVWVGSVRADEILHAVRSVPKTEQQELSDVAAREVLPQHHEREDVFAGGRFFDPALWHLKAVYEYTHESDLLLSFCVSAMLAQEKELARLGYSPCQAAQTLAKLRARVS